MWNVWSQPCSWWSVLTSTHLSWSQQQGFWLIRAGDQTVLSVNLYWNLLGRRPVLLLLAPLQFLLLNIHSPSRFWLISVTSLITLPVVLGPAVAEHYQPHTQLHVSLCVPPLVWREGGIGINMRNCTSWDKESLTKQCKAQRNNWSNNNEVKYESSDTDPE